MYCARLLVCYLLCIAVSAVLEHEAIAGLSAGKPTGLRGQGGSRGSISEDRNKDMSLDMLIKAVCNWCFVFRSYLAIVNSFCLQLKVAAQHVLHL